LQRIESEKKKRGPESGNVNMEKSSGNATSETTKEPLPTKELLIPPTDATNVTVTTEATKEPEKEKLVIPQEAQENV
jgi:hypothetical protein